MFNAILNYSASTYEAIILAFIVVGLIQTFALWRKADQVDELKKAIKGIVGVSMVAMIQSATRENAANRRARDAERLAMELQADADDDADESRASDPYPYADFAISPFADLARRADGHDPLASLIEKLSGGRRFGPITGGAFTPAPNSEFSNDDLKAALTGDLAAIERRHGAVPGSVHVEVLRADGSPVSDSERETLLDILNRADTTVEAGGDVTTLNEYAHGFEDHRPSGAPNFGVKVEHIDPQYGSPRAG